MLTETEIHHFHRDGYAILREAVSADQLAALRDETDHWLETSRKLTESTPHIELETHHTAENPRLRRLSHPVAMSDVYWQIASSQRIVDTVASLLGPQVKFHHSKLNMKASKGGTSVGWHQDFAFFPHTNSDLLACGIALDDATTENGCLLVIPGTHRIGLLSHRTADDDFIGQITEEHPFLNASRAVPVELKAGDMSIHHVSIIHGSTANESGRERRLFICQYAATDTIQLDFRQPPNAFTNRVLRGGPLTHARFADGSSLRLRGDVSQATSIFERQKAPA